MSVIDDLKSRLVGKTITDITPSFRAGAVCEIHYDGVVNGIGGVKGSLILTIGEHKLHVIDPIPKDLGEFLDLISDYKSSGLHSADLPELTVKRVNDQLEIEAFDGTTFALNLAALQSPGEVRILSHPQVAVFLPKIVDLGSFWRMAFLKTNVQDDSIPEELQVDSVHSI
jgi:hypothetical protein